MVFSSMMFGKVVACCSNYISDTCSCHCMENHTYTMNIFWTGDADREEFEMYEHLMASDIDEDLLTPTAPSTSKTFPDNIIEYPSPDFTLPQRQDISLISLSTDSSNLPHLSRPPGLDANISSVAALSVAQLWGSDCVNPTVL